jgi:hypothetical protein
MCPEIIASIIYQRVQLNYTLYFVMAFARSFCRFRELVDQVVVGWVGAKM